MSLDDYRNSELSTLFNVIEKYFEIQEKQQRGAWERTRWQTAALVNIQLKKSDRLKTTDLLPLPWDSENEGAKPRAMTYEEQKAAFEKIDAYMARKKAEKLALANGDR